MSLNNLLLCLFYFAVVTLSSAPTTKGSVPANTTQPPLVNTTSTNLTEILTSVEMVTEQRQSTGPPLPSLPVIHDGGQGDNLKMTTPSPDVGTTSLLTSIETDIVTLSTEQERPESATTPSVVDVTDLVTNVTEDIVTVGETDILTEIQTSKAGIDSSTEDIVSTTAQTGLVILLVTDMTTASDDITEVVSDVILTTSALDTTEATELVTETESLEITTGTQEAVTMVTTLETETVGVTDVDMTTVVELESTASTDEVTIEPVKTTVAVEPTEVPTSEITTEITEVTTQPDLETEIVDITTKQISTEQIQTTSVPSTQNLPMQATSNASQSIELLQTTSLQTTVPTTKPTARTSTPLATTKRKVITAPPPMKVDDMTDDDMKNVISLEFKEITVSTFFFLK